MAEAVADLLNIGPTTAAWLEEIGIHTRADLERVGVVKAYLHLKANYPTRINLNALWALQGALIEIHWTRLLPELKTELKMKVKTELEAELNRQSEVNS